MIPVSASDAKPKTQRKEEEQESNILALVRGERVLFTRKEAYALASQLIISLEVDENG